MNILVMIGYALLIISLIIMIIGIVVGSWLLLRNVLRIRRGHLNEFFVIKTIERLDDRGESA